MAYKRSIFFTFNFNTYLTYLSFIIITIVADGEISLVNGPTYNAGRIEIYHNTVWGTICDNNFDEVAADVACKQLGFMRAISFGTGFGPGKGPIWLDGVRCTGQESSLATCFHHGWGRHNCQHNRDVGVTCFDGMLWMRYSIA